MPRATDGKWALAACVVFFACGCGVETAPPYTRWVPLQWPEPSNSFQSYVSLASRAEKIAGDRAARVSFLPSERRKLVEDLSPAISDLRSLGSGVEFAMQPCAPGEVPQYLSGWRLLARALVWRIEDSVREERYGSAIRDAGTAFRFGFFLTGGGAIEADLGYFLIDETRRALAPHLQKFSSENLDALFDAVRTAHESRPPMSATVQNERLNMLASVQFVQDAYKDHQLQTLREILGPTVGEATDYLEGIRKKDAEKRPKYFKGFSAEAEEWARVYMRYAGQNYRQRQSEGGPQLADARPWKRFAKHFFTTLKPIFEKRDESLARLRLLALECRARAQVKKTGAAPNDLNSLSDGLCVDPYSGQPFVYRSDGAEFRVYSIGEDLKDDGGETDEAGFAPDLVLERELQ